MLELLGAANLKPTKEHVAILVGPNGSGKSNFLRALAEQVRPYRNLAVISNTAYDRFSGMRGIKRISASRSGRSPKGVIKLAVAESVDQPDSRFYNTGAILDYCGYQPRFGFRVQGIHKQKLARFADIPQMDHADLE